MHIYDAVVPPFSRQLTAMVDLVELARKACIDDGAVESELVGARIHPTMLPFAYQIKSTAEHSMGSIISARRGTASPNLDRPPDSLEGLTRKLDAALEGLAKVTPDEMERKLS
jgi:hypothetical protein